MMQPILLAAAGDYFNIYEFYTKKFSELYVDPKIFIEYNLILLIAFLIRLGVLYKIESRKKAKANEKQNKYTYIFGHIGIEWFIATLVTYFIVKSTNALLDSYIINLMIAPFAGFIAGLYIDLKLLIPAEANTPMGSLMSIKSKKESKSDDTTVNININSYPDHKEEESINDDPMMNIRKLDEKILEDEENFNTSILNAINEVISVQNSHSKKIDDTDDKLNSIIVSIDHLRESDMIDKQVSLKHMIYKCLNNGFATPEENDKITKLYYAYHELLGGNHEVETLYEDHYLKLPIHEERRIVNTPVIVEKRSGPVVAYGVYDNE